MFMVDLVPPLRLVAVEERKPMGEGQTKPRLVVASDEHDQLKPVVLKLRHPSTSVGDGHFAGTSLACELICAVLARAIGLKVPDYAIVEVTREFANSIHDRSTRHLFVKNIGENFGSVFHPSSALWQPTSREPSQEVVNQLEDILTFDGIVLNGDRQISNPNLLYRGDQLFLIDHSLALPVYWPSEQKLKSSSSFSEDNILDHCASLHLKGRDCSYSRVCDNWQARINTQKLDQLRAMLPPSWEHKQGNIDQIVRFLDRRNRHLANISTNLMRVLS